jgi:hypothetical protein
MQDWAWVGRWIKSEKNAEKLRETAEGVRDHWREVALDRGLDPDKNVIMQESDTQIRVGISETMDEEFRSEPGTWRQ